MPRLCLWHQLLRLEQRRDWQTLVLWSHTSPFERAALPFTATAATTYSKASASSSTTGGRASAYAFTTDSRATLSPFATGGASTASALADLTSVKQHYSCIGDLFNLKKRVKREKRQAKDKKFVDASVRVLQWKTPFENLIKVQLVRKS